MYLLDCIRRQLAVARRTSAICMAAPKHLKWRHTLSLVRREQRVSPFIKCRDVVLRV
jgi:hypothetical protein